MQLVWTTRNSSYHPQAKTSHGCRPNTTTDTRFVTAKANRKNEDTITYGNDWYRKTKTPRRTVREELKRRREANQAANNGRDRKDLYTDKWDGSEYKGSQFNILTVILIVSVLTPLLGIIFTYFSYGKLWG